jgi:hypothetical protein
VTTTLLPVALTTILFLLILLTFRLMTFLALTFADSTSGRMVAATLPLTGIGLTLL